MGAAAAEKNRGRRRRQSRRGRGQRRGSRRKERRRGKRIENSLYDNESQQQYRNQIQKMVLFLSTRQKMKISHRKLPKPFEEKPSKKKFYLSSISIKVR